MSEPSSAEQLKGAGRDHTVLRARLLRWLEQRLALQSVELSELVAPSSNGMSSETLLFEVSWQESGQHRQQRCVARLPPEATALPVFPSYDMDKQFRVMQLVGARSSAPVPRVLWSETDEAWLGAPFFVMERLDGDVPPDVMPYPFGSWLADASAEQQRQLQERSLAVLAVIHSVNTTPAERNFLQFKCAGASALRRHVAAQRAYYAWVAQEERSPLIERCFAWLETHWPARESEEVISWGDSRIGNILYRDFVPVAVLDWEMAGVAPREVDLGWMIFLHHFFQDFAALMSLPGMPNFMRLNEVVQHYAQLTNYQPQDMAFYTFYAALRHAIVMFRIGKRTVLAGQAEPPAHPDDMIYHKDALEAMMNGSYWNESRAG